MADETRDLARLASQHFEPRGSAGATARWIAVRVAQPDAMREGAENDRARMAVGDQRFELVYMFTGCPTGWC